MITLKTLYENIRAGTIKNSLAGTFACGLILNPYDVEGVNRAFADLRSINLVAGGLKSVLLTPSTSKRWHFGRDEFKLPTNSGYYIFLGPTIYRINSSTSPYGHTQLGFTNSLELLSVLILPAPTFHLLNYCRNAHPNTNKFLNTSLDTEFIKVLLTGTRWYVNEDELKAAGIYDALMDIFPWLRFVETIPLEDTIMAAKELYEFGVYMNAAVTPELYGSNSASDVFKKRVKSLGIARFVQTSRFMQKLYELENTLLPHGYRLRSSPDSYTVTTMCFTTNAPVVDSEREEVIRFIKELVTSKYNLHVDSREYTVAEYNGFVRVIISNRAILSNRMSIGGLMFYTEPSAADEGPAPEISLDILMERVTLQNIRGDSSMIDELIQKVESIFTIA